MLWLRGALARSTRPAVAIVGSRAASPYALEVAEQLAADLAARGLTVVSGLARGVDSAAHRGALAAAATTVAVLGCGRRRHVSARARALAREIARTRRASSASWRPARRRSRSFFPQRNRIISGLSRAVVVIEAGEKSGSLITARCALEQGRDVLAVPGNVLNGRNRGGHALIRDGAKIVESADDILEELGLRADGAAARRRRSAAPPIDDPVLAASDAGRTVRSGHDGGADRLASPRSCCRACSTSNCSGFVSRAGGGRFVRFDSSC